MGKIGSAVLIIFMLFSLSACGKDGVDSKAPDEKKDELDSKLEKEKNGLDSKIFEEGKAYAKLMYNAYHFDDNEPFESEKDKILKFVESEPKNKVEESFRMNIGGMYYSLTLFDDQLMFNSSALSLENQFDIKFE